MGLAGAGDMILFYFRAVAFSMELGRARARQGGWMDGLGAYGIAFAFDIDIATSFCFGFGSGFWYCFEAFFCGYLLDWAAGEG